VVNGGDILAACCCIGTLQTSAAKLQQGGHQTNQWQGHTEEAHESDEGL